MKRLIILALIPCLPLIVYCSMSYSAVLLDRIVATVNNEVITWSELRSKIEIDGKEFLKGLSDEKREKKIKEIEKPFLKSMIDLKLQIQAAQKNGLDVSESETESAIADIKKKYNLTDESLIKTLKTEGLTLEEYKTRLKEQILLSKVVRYEVNNSIVITDEEIKEYYEANKEKYSKEVMVRISQVFFAGNERDISQKNEIETKAGKIIQRVRKGKDFTKIAEEFSKSTNNEFVGDLGYVSRGSVFKEIEDVAFTLKVGEVSRPFWGPAGLHIIKVEDRIEGSDIDKVRNEIKEILFEEEFKLKYDDWVKTLREKAYIEIKL